MFATSGSSVLSAWLFLITLATTICRSAGQPLQSIACSQPDSFTVQIIENKNVVVYGTELLIKYDPHARIHPLPGMDAVNVVYDESTIEFKGYMSLEHSETQPWESPETLSWTSSGIILGTGTLQKLSREDYALQECRLFLPKNITSSNNMPYAVKDEIAKHARNCIEQYLCRSIGQIKIKEAQNSKKYDKSESDVPVPDADASYNSLEEFEENTQNCTDSVNLDLNEAMNLVIRTAVGFIKDNNMTKIVIPNLDESVPIGPFGKAYFQAINGTFEDLSTLKSAENAYVTGVKRTHVIKLGFGLGLAKFHYDYYHVKYGIIQFGGEITGTIDGITVSISLIVDYNKECPLTLEYMRVTLGKINLQMTGINNVTSKIINWLTSTIQNKIKSTVEVKAKEVIDNLLSKYACTTNMYRAFG